ncbi:hypothetical protein D9619_003703 [Psilocybe cf. subviscida]|uniref:Tat pathway signal sequence n=1 Tax=Psilocybe cf. subviscida TaxID=2480587 RepID=A0A8H5AYB0_9AGAR|nr:hypothetical protein D9619_003703 [Psilocybe cf. subviscida]
MAPTFKKSYKHLNDAENAEQETSISPPESPNSRPGAVIHLVALWAVLLAQAAIISLLLLRLRRGEIPYRPHLLYSPADRVVKYEVKTFNFGIGDDLSPFQQPPSDELDEMWEDLYNFGVHRIPKEEAALLPNKTSAIPDDPDGYYIAELEIFHQLHCLNMIRKALYPERYPDMALGGAQADEHVGHCIDAIRQGLMCAADTSVIVWQWDEKQQRTTFRGNVAHTCRNFDAIRDWAMERQITEKYHQEVYMEDDIRIPLYNADGSFYFPET